jgi:general secretion pathway protein M
MKAWFFGLQPRERAIAVGGVALAVAILLWAFLVRPLLDETAALRTAVETKQRLAVDVARIEGAQPSSVAANRQGADQTLSVIIINTASNYGLGQPRTTNDGPNTTNVTLQNVSFDSITAWLVTLHDTYGVDVQSASFSPAREPGIVNGQVSLRRL